jgi:hypothetical protein
VLNPVHFRGAFERPIHLKACNGDLEYVTGYGRNSRYVTEYGKNDDTNKRLGRSGLCRTEHPPRTYTVVVATATITATDIGTDTTHAQPHIHAAATAAPANAAAGGATGLWVDEWVGGWYWSAPTKHATKQAMKHAMKHAIGVEQRVRTRREWIVRAMDDYGSQSSLTAAVLIEQQDDRTSPEHWCRQNDRTIAPALSTGANRTTGRSNQP